MAAVELKPEDSIDPFNEVPREVQTGIAIAIAEGKEATPQVSSHTEQGSEITTKDSIPSTEVYEEESMTVEKTETSESPLELEPELQTTTEDSESPKETHENITTKEETLKDEQDSSEPQIAIESLTLEDPATNNEESEETETEDQTDGENLINLLPTELCHGILSFLDDDEKERFSRCSRHCYFLSFPLRFNGRVILSKHEDGVGIGDFADGKWLEPLRYHIRSAKIHFWQNELHRSLQSIAIFPRLINLTICLTMDKGFERNLSVAVISSLSKLPFYDNIESLTLDWSEQRTPGGLSRRHIELTSDSEDEEFRVTYRRGPGEMRLHKAYKQGFPRLSSETKEFLGGFIKGGELSTVVKKLKFPKYLRSLDFNISCEDSAYALPFFQNCNANGSNVKVDCGLLVRGNSFPILDLNTRPKNEPAEIKTIKRLSLGFPKGHLDYDSIKVKYLLSQFPNLEVLKFVEYSPYDAEELWETLPNLSKLQRVEYAWPRRPGSYGTSGRSVYTGDLEEVIEKRLKNGDFGCLKWVNIRELWPGSTRRVREGEILRVVEGGEVVRRRYVWWDGLKKRPTRVEGGDEGSEAGEGEEE
ncbi:hypothetical protein AOL_s00075g77 [Orbilia oligospora ATCC 24927]|uniref:F-box domain-containing protein n=1 Tax=Arthrobotrys oligospora (strain ATCC 24927 / CBS 115.81 / DSM 1491) TaxID=756982 RepID=G1X878_ARTOA|nr:hypothetical protein AOL_s00075g77 [Orbilia oligospora ATCC 24927]EGX50651.1 hypothetical protein AOL_s00075g77 [Orbilia oligospora ATCC 24927]